MARKMAECRRFESESGCTLTIIGEEDEVLEAAVTHAVGVHRHEDTPELRAMTRDLLEDAGSYIPGSRETEPFPA
jgi:hypothetical protein